MEIGQSFMFFVNGIMHLFHNSANRIGSLPIAIKIDWLIYLLSSTSDIICLIDFS